MTNIYKAFQGADWLLYSGQSKVMAVKTSEIIAKAPPELLEADSLEKTITVAVLTLIHSVLMNEYETHGSINAGIYFLMKDGSVTRLEPHEIEEDLESLDEIHKMIIAATSKKGVELLKQMNADSGDGGLKA